MKLIGAVGIKVRPVARDFKRELNSQINDLPEKEVKVKVNADTRAAERDIKNAKDKAERESITLPVGIDYDGLRNAQQQIRQALKKVADEPFTLKMDTKSLNDGLKDIKKRLGEAEVSMHVAQDEAGFRSVLAKIEQIRRAKTEIPVKFTANAKDLRRQEREIRKELEQAVINKGIKLSYVPDREGLAGAIKTIDDALRNLKRVQINPKLNKEELQRERDRLQAQLDAKPAVLKINKDVKGYEAALKHIRNLQREAAQVRFPFHLDKEGLKKAEKQLEEWRKREVEKAGIKIEYTNDRDGLKDAIQELDDALAGFKKKITVNPKFNEEALAAEKAKLEKQLAEIPLKIKYHDDREGIKGAIEELKKLKREAEIELQYKKDSAGLDEAINLLQWELDSKPATLKMVPDRKGYEEALKQIEELQRLAKGIEFEYGTDEQGLKEAADKLRQNIAALPPATVPVKLKYNNDTLGIKGAIGEIEKKLKEVGQIEIKADFNEADLLAKKAELEQMLKESSFEIKVNSKDLASLKKERERLAELYRDETGNKTSLTVEMNEESISRAAREIDDLIREAEKKPVKLDVEPVGVALAATQIGWASRSRVVPFFIRIDNKSRAVAEGVIKSLSGYNTMSSLGKTLERVMTNFDTVIAKGALVAGVIGNIVNTLGFALTNVLAIGDGMAQVVGIAAMAPAALSAAAAIVLVNVAAFRDFKGAIDGTKGALEKLPANAQAAALALRGTWEAIQQPIQNAYWEAMGTSLQDMVSVLLPQVRDGLATAGTHIGQFAKNTADTMRKLGDNDGMKAMFTNLGDMFKNATGIAEPLTMAINTLGLRGSEYLPRFGQWLTDITVQFNDWIQTADQAGDINRWIEDGVQSLKDMWSAGDGVLDVIRGITGAAMAAGGQTLGGFADEMQRWGEIANGEPFQSRMTQIFRGARDGASQLNIGFKDLGRAAGESSSWISKMLVSLGALGGISLSNFALFFRSGDFKGGIYEAVLGLNDMMRDLAPSFSSVASVIGTLGSTAAATFRGLAPLVNTVTSALEGVTDILGDELPGIATILTRSLNGTFTVIGSAIKGVAMVVEPLLRAFLAMPDAIQTILLAAGGFMIMRGQISKMMTALADKGHFRRFESSWSDARRIAGNEASRIAVGAQMVGTATGNMVVRSAAGLHSLSQSWGNYSTAVRNAQGFTATAGTAMWMPVQKGASLAKSALGGVVGLLGGPWGAAIAAAGIGISLFAQKQAKAKQQVDATAASLDQQTGAITDSTKKLVAEKWMQNGTTAWDDFWRGAVKGAKAAHETVGALGDSTEGVNELILEGGEAYEEYIDKLKLIEKHLNGAKLGYSDGSAPYMSMEKLSEATGYAESRLRSLNTADFTGLIGQSEGARDMMAEAERKTAALGTALGISDTKAAGMEKALEGLNGETGTASERVDDFKLALDRLNNGSLSVDEAARNWAKTFDSGLEQIRTAAGTTEEGVQLSLDHLVDATTGAITDMRGKGGELYDATKSISDGLIDRAMAASQHVLDMDGSVEDAQASALEALKMTDLEVEEFARSVGVHTDTARLMLERMTGEDWELKAILSGDAKLFFEEKKKAEDAGQAFGVNEWNAILTAKNLTDKGLNAAKADGQAWNDADWTAALLASPESAMATLAQTLGVTDEAWRRGDFSAILTALNGAGPGVAAALFSLAAVTDGDYTAEIEALLNELSKEQAAKELDDTANADRSAYIKAVPQTEDARLALDGVAEPRDSPVTARPSTFDAQLALDTTANPRDAPITGQPNTNNAVIALDTAANPRTSTITGVPNTGTAESRLNTTANDRDSWFIGHDNLDWARMRMNDLARPRNATFFAVAETRDAANALASLSATRTVYYRAQVEQAPIPAADGAIVSGKGVQLFANGGIFSHQVKAFANGGTENHVAQISRGQTPYRIWSEPETGGEAYIPLSTAKRSRSTQILEQVATQFGYALTRENTTQFSNGGVVNGGRTGGGVSVNIGSYVTSRSDTPDDVARALMRRVKVQGANSPLEAF